MILQRNIKKVAKSFIYTLNKNPISISLYTQEIKKRAKLPITDVEPLSKHISVFSPFTSEIHPPNDWYGHASSLKIFLGLPQNYQFKFILEHGLYLNEQVDPVDIETNLPTIITYSDYRVNVLKQYRNHVFSIGPFIHYARDFLSEKEIVKEKKRLGKSLLFFPAHSSSMIDIEYDILKLCKQIIKIAKDFDNIRVCLYWKDILLGKHKVYQDFGFDCVTAGHMLDPLFLQRLKSIIKISDLTVSNIVSAHVGYCIHLNKPHIILSNKFRIETSKKWKDRINEIFKSKAYNEIINEFSKLNFKITETQKQLIEKYWGTNKIKTKPQLKRITVETEKIYNSFKNNT